LLFAASRALRWPPLVCPRVLNRLEQQIRRNPAELIIEIILEGYRTPRSLRVVGKAFGRNEVPDALGQPRKGQGPPRVFVHPTPAES
jgi:hypothetical protein